MFLDRLDAIHQSNLRKWAAVNDALGGAMSGMDYMTPDINGTKGYVIDVNNFADDIIHLKASFGDAPEQHKWLPLGPTARFGTKKGMALTKANYAKRRAAWHSLVPCYYYGNHDGNHSFFDRRYCRCYGGKRKKRKG